MHFTPEQVLNLAPDAASARAGQGLAASRHWQALGRAEQALWGLCQGSGKNPYQVRVALPELVAACSCPSRKFPCKHALGLLLLAAGQPDALVVAEPPGFVAEWLAKRAAKAEKVAPPSAAPANPEAAARTAKKRAARIGEGLRDFKAWLEDLVGTGFAHAPVREPSFWDSRARRLVDAQAPGLARAVGELASIPIRQGAWPEQLLRALAPLYLATDAFERADTLPPALHADLQRAIGVPQKQEDVDPTAAIEDDWLCLGQSAEDLERVVAHRTWLFGQHTGRHALILNFTPAGQKPDLPALPGASETMRLAFFPGGVPQRALIVARCGQPRNDSPAPAGSSIAAELDRCAAARATDPWFSLAALLVRARLARNGKDWWLVDADGGGLPILFGDMPLWSWFVASGGGPAVFSGEWDGEWFRPLHAWTETLP